MHDCVVGCWMRGIGIVALVCGVMEKSALQDRRILDRPRTRTVVYM